MISIREARKELQNGNIIIYPTDTVWGMGCDPFNQKAIDKLFSIKGKKRDGLSVMFDNIEKIYETCEINKASKKIIEEFLPGPVTLIMKSKKKFAEGVMRNGNIAVRIPMNDTSLKLAKEIPVVTTSANLHGEDIAENIEDAKKIFGTSCFYLDGEKPKGIESTIIDLTGNKPEITRIGALYSTILEGMFES
jgi:L-threonylcarbamoyladenylate synthase